MSQKGMFQLKEHEEKEEEEKKESNNIDSKQTESIIISNKKDVKLPNVNNFVAVDFDKNSAISETQTANQVNVCNYVVINDPPVNSNYTITNKNYYTVNYPKTTPTQTSIKNTISGGNNNALNNLPLNSSVVIKADSNHNAVTYSIDERNSFKASQTITIGASDGACHQNTISYAPYNSNIVIANQSTNNTVSYRNNLAPKYQTALINSIKIGQGSGACNYCTINNIPIKSNVEILNQTSNANISYQTVDVLNNDTNTSNTIHVGSNSSTGCNHCTFMNIPCNTNINVANNSINNRFNYYSAPSKNLSQNNHITINIGNGSGNCNNCTLNNVPVNANINIKNNTTNAMIIYSPFGIPSTVNTITINIAKGCTKNTIKNIPNGSIVHDRDGSNTMVYVGNSPPPLPIFPYNPFRVHWATLTPLSGSTFATVSTEDLQSINIDSVSAQIGYNENQVFLRGWLQQNRTSNQMFGYNNTDGTMVDINDINSNLCPANDVIANVTNSYGISITIIVRKTGKIQFDAWSIPTGFFFYRNTGNSFTVMVNPEFKVNQPVNDENPPITEVYLMQDPMENSTVASTQKNIWYNKFYSQIFIPFDGISWIKQSPE